MFSGSFDRMATAFTPRLSVKEQAFFAKRLSFLVKAGVPILESLQVLREQTKSRSLSRIIEKVIHDVSNGQYLSKSLGKFPGIFGEFAINLIQVGESSGILSQNLNYLADELKKRHALKRKVVGALVYPIFITFATLGLTIMLTVFVFPKIMPIFTSLNVKLPLSTRIVIFVSEFLRDYGLYCFFGLVLGVIGLSVVHRKSDAFRYQVDRLILNLPLFGSMIRYYNLANMCRTMGLMLKSGIRLSEAIPITAETTGNRVFKRELERLAEAALRGGDLSVYLKKRKDIFPEMLAQLVSVGERTGSLSDTFMYLAELYESEVEDLTKNLSSLIEPVLMIVMGLLVGIIAISIITPIYEITQHLTPQ